MTIYTIPLPPARMTPQQFLDRVVERAKLQKKATNEDPATKDNCPCLYRTKGGNRCFLGEFIPDKVYHKSMEGLPGESLVIAYAKELDELQDLPGSLLQKVQCIHDKYGPALWKEKLAELAQQYNLELKWQ